MPERPFGADVPDYLYGGAVTMQRNEDAFHADGSSTDSRFCDLVTICHGHVAQIFAFNDSKIQYEAAYAAARMTKSGL